MNESKVADLLSKTAHIAQEATQERPMVDVDTVEHLAHEHRLVSAKSGRRLVAAVATAAAVAIIAVSTTLITGRMLVSDPVPEYLVALVDSLYPETDYMVDEISPYMSGSDDFLDSVWSQVIDQSTE